MLSNHKKLSLLYARFFHSRDTLLCLRVVLCPQCRKMQRSSACGGHERYIFPATSFYQSPNDPRIHNLTFILLTSKCQDSRWHQLQHLYPATRLSSQALQFDFQPKRLSTRPNLSTCALDIFLPNVPCPWASSTAFFPALFLRWQSRGPWPPSDCPTKLEFPYLRQRDAKYFDRAENTELCARECGPVTSTYDRVTKRAAEE